MFTTVNMSWSARSKNLLDDLKSRDPNVRVYTDTKGDVTETFTLDWSRIYSIFDNDDLLEVENHSHDFQNIAQPQIHVIVSHPPIMP